MRSAIIQMIKEKLPVLNPDFASNITLNLIRPPMTGANSREASNAFDAAIWSLVADGIIVPGTASTVAGGTVNHTPGAHGSFPYFRVTPLGRKIATSEDVIDPLDSSTYLKDAKARLPDGDEVIFAYLAEANKNFIDRSYLSATVMLGVSAEGLMRWLIKALLKHVSESQATSYSNTFEQHRFKTNKLFSEFFKLLRIHLEEVDEDLRFQADAYLEQLSTIIRVNRDDVAHGRATRVERQLVYGNLILYLSLLRVASEISRALEAARPCTK